MDSIDLLFQGFAAALQPQYLLYAFLGVFIGTAVGVLPGIGPAMTVALLLPLTYTLDPTAALITFAGIYYGGMYGGSTTSILLNTPGESASIVTALEGHKMAKLGRGAAALATAAIGSFVAGTIATIALTFVAPIIAAWAITLTPADYFALMVVAFLTVGALLGSSASRGLASLAIGLFIGLIGIEVTTGQARYTFGMPFLLDGIDVVIVAVGLFAVGLRLFGVGYRPLLTLVLLLVTVGVTLYGVAYALDEHNRPLISQEVLTKVNEAKSQIVVGEIKVTDAMAN